MDFLLPIWDPFVDAMVWAILQFYNYIAQYHLPSTSALTIIAFTIVLRVLVVPLYMQQMRTTKVMQQIQPEIQALQKKYGKDREKIMQEQMKLYREYKINPLGGCLPMLVQMPIWVGLYSALERLRINTDQYPQFQEAFLWIPNITHPDPIYILPVLTVISQWVVTRMMMTPSADPQQQQMNQVMQFMPLMFGFFAIQVQAGLVLYWIISNVATIIQQYFTSGLGGLKPQPALATAAADTRASGGSSSGNSSKASDNGRGGADGADRAARAGTIDDDEIVTSEMRGGLRVYTLKSDGHVDHVSTASASPATGGTATAGGRRRLRKRPR